MLECRCLFQGFGTSGLSCVPIRKGTGYSEKFCQSYLATPGFVGLLLTNTMVKLDGLASSLPYLQCSSLLYGDIVNTTCLQPNKIKNSAL